MNIKNLKLGQQLLVSFGLVLTVFVVSSLVQINRLNTLGNLQHEGAQRAEGAIIITEASALPYQFYQIIGDAIINRDLLAAQNDWSNIVSEASVDYQTIQDILDTDLEKRQFAESKEAKKQLITLVESGLLPLLNTDLTGKDEEEIHQLDLEVKKFDAQIDRLIIQMREPLLQIRQELIDESAEADEVYDASQDFLITLSLIFLGVAIILAIIISIAITRSITSSLGGEPSELEEIANRMGNGDLTINTNDVNNRQGVIRKMLEMVDRLKSVMVSVTTGADNINSASQQLSGGAQQISSGVSEQAASAEEVSSSMEEMAANIQQNTGNALKTRELSGKASKDVEEVAAASEESMQAVNDINDKINVVVQIAEKTDLLAINAAVEAARAGDEGRGFAVVAAEVRKLAERSQEAANSIVSLAERGAQLSEKSTAMLKAIVPNIIETSQLVDEIATGSQEQETGVNQVNSAIQQLSHVTQQNASNSEEMASSSEELSSQANELEEITSFFKLGHTTRRRSNGVKKADFIAQPNLGNIAQQGVEFDMSQMDSSLKDYQNI
ncbi:methyl-accepting chemotaxis protein [Carboxylicivirga marina]|uniref:methyl-accepting chemotaxis protein n=1 Tax=Carboxylicivirga marina TaxID=2800988 RepID=UPI002591ED98|nr:methyl-accepting chemotaxis protein [uncultured Carboxylicivirga sp.]